MEVLHELVSRDLVQLTTLPGLHIGGNPASVERPRNQLRRTYDPRRGRARTDADKECLGDRSDTLRISNRIIDNFTRSHTAPQP